VLFRGETKMDDGACRRANASARAAERGLDLRHEPRRHRRMAAVM
jgi:hypothetical protein